MPLLWHARAVECELTCKCSVKRAADASAAAAAALLPLFPAGFPQLYFYMLAQRRKVLRGGRSSSAAKLKST